MHIFNRYLQTSRPMFINLYIVGAILISLIACVILGQAATRIVDEIVVEQPGEESPSQSYADQGWLGIAPFVWVLGLVPMVAGFFTAIGVWLMRKWGALLAVTLHGLGSIYSGLWFFNRLSNDPHLLLLIYLALATLIQFFFIYWFVRHWPLFHPPQRGQLY
jgi:peptidoglycan biosynthesis protein MviN/MurJ (putative lipid II flippase)